MAINQKNLRYYYWVLLEFAKKHLRLILMSFSLSIIVIAGLVSFSPYIISYFTLSKEVVGLVGTYDSNNMPDNVLSKVSNGLVVLNEKGEILPILISNWEVSNDGKQYVFYLRKNLFWNDGKPFTAVGLDYKFKDVEVKVLNDYKIEFKLKKPLPIFLTYLATPIVRYPLVGVAGLYRTDRVKSQYGNIREVYLNPNKNNLPYIVYKFYDNETKMIDAYKLGEINQMVISKKSVADTFSNWKNTIIDKNVDYSRLMTLFFNMNNDFLKQKDSRRAIEMAISRTQFSEDGIEAYGPIPPVSWAYNQNIKKAQFDPDLSAKMLKKTYESTSSAALEINTYYDYLYIAEAVKSSMERAGLKVKIKTLSYSQPDSFDMLLAYWKVPMDPDQYYFWHSTQKQGNIINYSNIKIDKLLEDGRNSTSLEERKRIYDDFQKTIVDDLPAYFIFYPYIYTIKRK